MGAADSNCGFRPAGVSDSSGSAGIASNGSSTANGSSSSWTQTATCCASMPTLGSETLKNDRPTARRASIGRNRVRRFGRYLYSGAAAGRGVRPVDRFLDFLALMASTAGEIRIGDAVDRLAEQLNLTPDDRAELFPSGKQTLFGDRVHWAKTYLTKAGLLESTRRGHFKITERGQQVIASHPPRIDNEFLNQFAEFRQFKEKSATDAAQGSQPIEPALVSRTETPDEIMRVAHKQVETSHGQDLLDRVRTAPPAFFERLMGRAVQMLPSWTCRSFGSPRDAATPGIFLKKSPHHL